MFSNRVSWSLAPNRLSLLLKKKREEGQDVLDLTQSNPTRVGLEYPREDILDCLADRRALIYEPAPTGLEATRRAVAQYYRNRGRRVDADDILLTASTSEAYAFLFKILAKPGDQVLIPRPSYPLFDYLAALECVDAASYSLVYDGSWSIDFGELERSPRSRARALLVVHPGNPTGSFLKKDELPRLVDICRRQRLALIIDEVFIDYAFADDARRAGSLAGCEDVLTFVLSGLSKVAGLPQMKLSWIAIGGPEDLRLEARQRLEQVSDLFLSVGATVQHAAESLLALASRVQPAIAARVTSNYGYIRESTTDTPINVLGAEGGWYAILRLPAVRTSEGWALEILSSDNLHIHPGYLFDFPIESCLVVSLLTPPATLHSGIRRLVERVEQTLSSPISHLEQPDR